MPAAARCRPCGSLPGCARPWLSTWMSQRCSWPPRRGSLPRCCAASTASTTPTSGPTSSKDPRRYLTSRRARFSRHRTESEPAGSRAACLAAQARHAGAVSQQDGDAHMLTDSQLEALTARLRRGRESLAGEIPRRPAGLGDLPLSYGQEQLWFLDRFAPGLSAYNIPLLLRMSGPLDAAAAGPAGGGAGARRGGAGGRGGGRGGGAPG